MFSPSLRNHYLNVTPNNLVHIYSLDSGDWDFLQPPQPSPKVSGAGEMVLGRAALPGFSQFFLSSSLGGKV